MNNILERYIERIDESIERNLNGTGIPGSEKLTDAMRYSLFAGGKRVRPALTCAFCELCGGNVSDALDLAAAVEMIHVFSLIHDDMPEMDDDVLRRGKPTNHVVFGTGTALLAGDALVFSAFSCIARSERLSDAQKTEATSAVCGFCGTDGMIGGQRLDMAGEERTLTQDEVISMYKGKTCALISLACLLGVIAANGTETMKKCAVEYGEALGMAFQINDDLIELAESPDADDGKTTFITSFGEDVARETAEKYTEAAKSSLGAFGEKERADLVGFCEIMLRRKK